MTHVFRPLPHEMAKWREQADRAAAHLKAQAITKAELKLAFAFDDGIITVTIGATDIRDMTQHELADFFYQTVLAAAQTGGNA